MAKKDREAPPLMNFMGLMYFDEEDTGIRLSGEKFPEIMLVLSVILFTIAIIWP